MIWYFYFNNEEPENNIQEYQPQEEITNEQMRQTIVTLYFKNKETNQLVTEGKLIDSKLLLTDPYKELIELLIEGPKNEKYTKLIPENTKLNQTYKEKDMVYLDFSSEFLNYDKEDTSVKQNMIDSLVKTLTQLTEVNSIKILINGEENEEFNEIYTLENNS